MKWGLDKWRTRTQSPLKPKPGLNGPHAPYVSRGEPQAQTLRDASSTYLA
jgi:hypothetical protein